MGLLTLKTFQLLDRVGQLEREQLLTGDWAHVQDWDRHGYRLMVDAMARHGIDTGGRPPIWAWAGRVTLLDASLLLNTEHDLPRGYATVTFTVPAEQALIGDYGHWCDALAEGPHLARYDPVPPRPGVHAAQACVAALPASAVTGVSPLPRDGWDDLDLDAEV